MIGCQTFTCCSAIIKIPEHPKFDCLEPKGNRPADTSWRNAALEGTHSSHTSVTVRRDISPNDNLEHPAREAQRLASEKEEQDWKSSSRRFAKRKSSGSGQTTALPHSATHDSNFHPNYGTCVKPVH